MRSALKKKFSFSSVGIASLLMSWDPFDATFLKTRSPSANAIRTHQADVRRVLREPLENIFVIPDESDPTAANCLIVGPSGTPYENGFFFFRYVVSDDYPDTPPRVKLMTTGHGAVRFNPNLYACGKVCLSILGTWEGPGWKPSMRLPSVLLSIQSLMSPNPILNEPGYNPGLKVAGQHYTAYVQHESIRVAVLDFIDPSKEGVPSFARESLDPHGLPQPPSGEASVYVHPPIATVASPDDISEKMAAATDSTASASPPIGTTTAPTASSASSPLPDAVVAGADSPPPPPSDVAPSATPPTASRVVATPPEFIEIARSVFRTPAVYAHYVHVCTSQVPPFNDGATSEHPFARFVAGGERLRYTWEGLRCRLQSMLRSLGGPLEDSDDEVEESEDVE